MTNHRRKNRPHPAREARRTTGAVVAASTLGLVAVMSVQAVLDNMATTTGDEGVSALSSNDGGSQQQLFSDDGHAIIIQRNTRPDTRGTFTLRPALPSGRRLGSSHGS